MSSSISIPPKSRSEWRDMITGKIEHNYGNYVLQMKIHQAKKEVAAGTTPVNKAIDDIYELCSKYALAVQNDFKTIFKTW